MSTDILGRESFVSRTQRSLPEQLQFLVSDQYQKQGLGIELLCRTVQIARDEKLSSVHAEMLRDNLGVQIFSRKLGFV